MARLKLSKYTHFIHVPSTYKVVLVEYIFMSEIFRLYEIPKNSIFYSNEKFKPKIYKALFIRMGSQLKFSTTYHPQTNVKIKGPIKS